MKECPSCGASVPKSAERCKECFHDFSEVASRSNGGPIFLMGAAAAMAVIAAGTFWWVTSSPIEEKILVDEETRSIVWTRRYRRGVETEKVNWDEVTRLEYVLKSNNTYEIVAVDRQGERHIIQEDAGPLKSEADRYSQMMEKDLDIVDNTRGFHKLDK